jgi:3-dehydroquinate synthase
LGHAIESWGIINGRDIRHGEALAAGMIMALYLSGSVLGLLNDIINPIIQLLKKNIPLPELPESATKEIVSFLAHDKKNSRGKRMFVLLERPGSIRYDQEISDEMVFDAIQFYRENCFLAQIHDR